MSLSTLNVNHWYQEDSCLREKYKNQPTNHPPPCLFSAGLEGASHGQRWLSHEPQADTLLEQEFANTACCWYGLSPPLAPSPLCPDVKLRYLLMYSSKYLYPTSPIPKWHASISFQNCNFGNDINTIRRCRGRFLPGMWGRVSALLLFPWHPLHHHNLAALFGIAYNSRLGVCCNISFGFPSDSQCTPKDHKERPAESD